MSTILTHPDAPDAVRQYVIPDCYNLEAEQAILGAVLGNNEALNHLVPELRADHFYAGIHQRIFKVVRELAGVGQVANPVTLKHHFADEEKVEDKYLARLVAHATSIVNIHDYSSLVLELHLKRVIQKAAIEVVGLAKHGDEKPVDLVGKLASAIDEVTRLTAMRTMRTARDVTVAICDDLKVHKPRISTGMPRLDEALGGGFARGQSYCFAGRYGDGKTMMAGTLSHNFNHDGRNQKHLFITGEMTDEEIHQRSLARSMRVEHRYFHQQDGHPDFFWTDLGGEAIRGANNVIYQNDPFLTFDKLKQYVASAVVRDKIEGFILDYWQLVGGYKPGRKVEHLDDVAQWIAAACKEYNIWALVTAQLNREGESRGSDGALLAFSHVFYLQRPEKAQPYAWLERKKARDTEYMNVGSTESPAYRINGTGPFFEEMDTHPIDYVSPIDKERMDKARTAANRRKAKKEKEEAAKAETDKKETPPEKPQQEGLPLPEKK